MIGQENPGWLCFNQWSKPKPCHRIEFQLKDRRARQIQVRKGVYCGEREEGPVFKSGDDFYLGTEVSLWRYLSSYNSGLPYADSL